MAVSFFKKSFSAAYYGYQNKITNPDTPEEDEEEEEEKIEDESDNEYGKANQVQKVSKSKSAFEIVNLAKKNLVGKLSTNVTKLATYDHHSLLKSIEKEDELDEEDEEVFEPKSDQINENISFNLYDQSTLKPNQPFGLLNPNSLPVELKRQISQTEAPCSSDENSSDEYARIEFDKYDEYGFPANQRKKRTKDENLLEVDETDEATYKNDSNRINQNLEQEEEFYEKLKNKWLTYLELTYNQVDEPITKWYQIETKIKHTAQLDNLIQSGSIPYFLRNQLWTRFSNAYLMKEKCSFVYSELCKRSNHLRNYSDKQSLRILPSNICFQDQTNRLNQSLRRILRVIKWIERDGIDPISNNLKRLNLALIAAYLLLVINEEDAFWLLLSILNEWKKVTFINNSLIAKPNNEDLIKNLIKKHCPHLHAKLNEEEMDINLLINSWFTSIFVDVINDTRVLFYLFDLYFYYGFIVFFQLTLGLLLYRKADLIKLENSVDLFNTISRLPDELDSNDKLLQIWQLGRDNLSNFDREFCPIKNQNELQGELLGLGVPAVQLFSDQTNGIRLLSSSLSLNRLSDLNNELKFKNVRQSAILMELHQAILAIGEHFQSNDSDFKFNSIIDYDLKEVNKFYKTHKRCGMNKEQKESVERKKRRARALVDFKRIDDDELGFRKNDIIKILNDRDEHCWEGELNDQQGLFPAKFVEVLNENYCSYNEFGDDNVTPFINDLVRGRLCSVIKCILNNGLRKAFFFNPHPWIIIETLAKNYMKTQQNNICSKLVLTKTFKLDDFESNMNVRELFYKSILFINESHVNEPMDVKLRSLICVALNHKLLPEWFTIYCNEDKTLIKSYYHCWSYVTTPVWQMIKLEFSLLKQFSFNLNPNAELRQELEQASSSVSKAMVRDILTKHHLFSWDI